jgi:hypothetical protein
MTRDSDDNAFESKFGKVNLPPKSFFSKPWVWLVAGFVVLCLVAYFAA